MQLLLAGARQLPHLGQIPQVAEIEALLQAELRCPSEQAPLLFASAFDILQALPDDLASASRVYALRAIAIYYYNSAKPHAGLAPAHEALRTARLLGDPEVLPKALKVLGAMFAETGNLPGAIEVYSEALDLACSAADQAQQCSLWNNVGLVHMYACHYADAIACFERAVEIAAPHPELADDLTIARTNLAYAGLHSGDVAKGLRAAYAALATQDAPNDPVYAVARCGLEQCTALLLLETGDIGSAQTHAARARDCAWISGSIRAEIMAEIATGLTEVHAGDTEEGLTRLKQALVRGRESEFAILQIALSAAIKGYEVAGQPDVALVYLRELGRLRADAKQAQILIHHTQHLASINRRIDDDALRHAERQRAELRGKLSDRYLLRARIAMLEQSAVAGELHDDTTGEHCYRVGRLASLLAQEYGVDDETCFLIDLAARLHDIGKLAVPDVILQKPGKLTPEEFALIQTHTTRGAELLAESRIPQMHVAEEIARAHHERWDGTGYPHGLRGQTIPLAARITALADVFDALTHVRPYKRAWSVQEALREIASQSGRYFDPQLTAIFLELVPRLQREHGDLDAFLAIEAQNSPFIKARREIAAALKGENGEGIDVSLAFEGRR